MNGIMDFLGKLPIIKKAKSTTAYVLLLPAATIYFLLMKAWPGEQWMWWVLIASCGLAAGGFIVNDYLNAKIRNGGPKPPTP